MQRYINNKVYCLFNHAGIVQQNEGSSAKNTLIFGYSMFVKVTDESGLRALSNPTK